jgi:TolB-like protein
MERMILKSIIKVCIGIAIVIGLSLYVSSAADNPLATAVVNLAKQVTRQFGALELKVAAVQKDQVYLNGGRKQYVKLGTFYDIVAEGAAVTNPEPGNRGKIGTLETPIAEVKVIMVRDTLCIAQITQKIGEVPLKVGQKAIERSKLRSIAVIPFEYLNSKDKTTTRIIQELMINELIKSGYFIVADSLRTEQIANQLKGTSQPGSVQFTQAAGKLLGVDYIMYGSIVDLPGFMEIQCRIHDSGSGVGLAAGNVQIVHPAPPTPEP